MMGDPEQGAAMAIRLREATTPWSSSILAFSFDRFCRVQKQTASFY